MFAVSISEVTKAGRRRDIGKEVATSLDAVKADRPDYNAKIGALVMAILYARTKALAADGVQGKAVSAVVNDGYKFAKLAFGVGAEVNGRPRMKVEFFVERATGKIFGAKSDLAPNESRYFGTLDTIGAWDWSGQFPTTNDAAFVPLRKYGGVTLYADAPTQVENGTGA